MYKTGDKPGNGNYQCFNCGTIIQISNDTDALPPCPKCGCEKFIKVSKIKIKD